MNNAVGSRFAPLSFEPIFKEKIWGGRSLKTKLNKNIPEQRSIGESWEISAVPGSESKVGRGPQVPKTLIEILQSEGLGLVGSNSSAGAFPLLYKFIDARRDLSIQVHPDDRQARGLGQGGNGKTECWYIIEAMPGAEVICGFKRGINLTHVKEALIENQLPSVCEFVPVSSGDVIFVPAGTVHATLANTLLYEVQQTSDLIYRLYDWKRIDATGHSRPLHIDQALGILDVNVSSERKIEPVRLEETDCYHAVRMACRYFVMEEYRCDIAASWELPLRNSFQALSIIQGNLRILTENTEDYSYGIGESVLIPAGLRHARLSAPAGTLILASYVPDLLNDVIAPLRRLGVSPASIEQLGGFNPKRNDLSALCRVIK